MIKCRSGVRSLRHFSSSCADSVSQSTSRVLILPFSSRMIIPGESSPSLGAAERFYVIAFIIVWVILSGTHDLGRVRYVSTGKFRRARSRLYLRGKWLTFFEIGNTYFEIDKIYSHPFGRKQGRLKSKHLRSSEKRNFWSRGAEEREDAGEWYREAASVSPAPWVLPTGFLGSTSA